jgi:thiamine pyrophosphate-dependent acetolactate synthase large subunit-like protein
MEKDHSENHPLSLQASVCMANPLQISMGEVDVLLAVGTRFSDRATANLDSFAPNAKSILTSTTQKLTRTSKLTFQL